MTEIIICSGGTGGHMFPACTLLEFLKKKGYSVKLVTDERGNIFCVDIENTDKVVLETTRFSIRNVIPLTFKLLKIFFQLIRRWRKKSPAVIIGFGNFCTIVPIITAKIFGAKVILYEQNAVIGKANNFLKKIADMRFSNFAIDNSWRIAPAPVRKEFIEKKHSPYICNGKIKILVIGGSQGARSFNEIIPKAVSLLNETQRENIEIIQQVEYKALNLLNNYYHQLGIKASLVKFIYNVAEIMANAQLVICRAGASTLTELSTIGRPAILIPYPYSANNHQLKNAQIYEKAGAAWIIEEKLNNENTSEKLAQMIKNFLENKELLKSAASNMIKISTVNVTDNFVELIGFSLKEIVNGG